MAVIYNLIYLLPIRGNVSLSDIRMAYIVILIVLVVLFFAKKGRKEVYSDMGKLLLCAGLLPIIRICESLHKAKVEDEVIYNVGTVLVCVSKIVYGTNKRIVHKTIFLPGALLF